MLTEKDVRKAYIYCLEHPEELIDYMRKLQRAYRRMGNFAQVSYFQRHIKKLKENSEKYKKTGKVIY